jgi:hypothetical protein
MTPSDDAVALPAAWAGPDAGTVASRRRRCQRQGLRMRSIERDACTAATGYPPVTSSDGIDIRDRVWLTARSAMVPDGDHRPDCEVRTEVTA